MNKKGFTLVEMLAVVVLLGVLAMIAIPNYNKFVENARNTKKDADISAVKDATTAFISDCITKKSSLPSEVSSYCPASGTSRTIDKNDVAAFITALRNANYLSKDISIQNVEIKITYDSVNYSYDVTIVNPD